MPATTAPPQISVILPVKDGAAFLEAAGASILAQTFRDLELMIIDDGSSDETIQIAEHLCRADNRVRLLRNPGNGLVDALNFGISAARAPLLARMDADDIALPERLQRQYEYLEVNPDIDVVGTQVSFIDEKGAPTGKTTELPETPDAIGRTLMKYCCLRHPTAVMRREAVERVGLYRAKVPAAEDLDLWLRIAEQGELANLPEPLLLYRLHPAQVSQEKIWTQRLSRNLAVISAQERRTGGLDPLDYHACSGAGTEQLQCRGNGCSSAVCESIRVFALARSLLDGAVTDLSEDDSRLVLRYVSRHHIGDGKSNAVRVLLALCKQAIRQGTPLMLMKALGAAMRIHPGRAIRLLAMEYL